MRLMTVILLSVCSIAVLSGCRNMDNRRDTRRAAFEPLRPAPENRILPDNPIHIRPGKAVAKAINDNAQAKEQIAEAVKNPTVAEADKLQNAEPEFTSGALVRIDPKLNAKGLRGTVSRIKGQTLEIYLIADQPVDYTVIARAFNSANQEFNRAAEPAKFTAGEAKYLTFRFPEPGDLGSVKFIQLEPAP